MNLYLAETFCTSIMVRLFKGFALKCRCLYSKSKGLCPIWGIKVCVFVFWLVYVSSLECLDELITKLQDFLVSSDIGAYDFFIFDEHVMMFTICVP